MTVGGREKNDTLGVSKKQPGGRVSWAFPFPRTDLSSLQRRGLGLSTTTRMFGNCFNSKTATNMFTLHWKLNWNQMVKLAGWTEMLDRHDKMGVLRDTPLSMGGKQEYFYNTKTRSVSRFDLWWELLPLELSKSSELSGLCNCSLVLGHGMSGGGWPVWVVAGHWWQLLCKLLLLWGQAEQKTKTQYYICFCLQ